MSKPKDQSSFILDIQTDTAPSRVAVHTDKPHGGFDFKLLRGDTHEEILTLQGEVDPITGHLIVTLAGPPQILGPSNWFIRYFPALQIFQEPQP